MTNKYFSPETIDRWIHSLIRIYERQGSGDLSKYQYGIAKLIRTRTDDSTGKKLLKYVKDIAEPKDVLLEALIAIMLNDFISQASRTLAVDALVVLLPRREARSRYTNSAVTNVFKDVVNSPQTAEFRETVRHALHTVSAEVAKDNLRQAFYLTSVNR